MRPTRDSSSTMRSTEPAAVSSVPPTSASLFRRALPFAIGIVLAIALTSAVWWSLRPRSETPIVTRFTVPLADDELMASYPFRAIAISPDGRQIVWASNLRLNIRSMGSLTPTAIAGTDHGFAIGSPAFSPDGKSIVYATVGDRGAGVVFRTISTTGGVPTVVAQVGGNGGVSGLSWSDGGILYTDNSGIVRVSPSGGKPETVVPLAQGETMQGATALPGERAFSSRLRRDASPASFHQSICGTAQRSWCSHPRASARP